MNKSKMTKLLFISFIFEWFYNNNENFRKKVDNIKDICYNKLRGVKNENTK